MFWRKAAASVAYLAKCVEEKMFWRKAAASVAYLAKCVEEKMFWRKAAAPVAYLAKCVEEKMFWRKAGGKKKEKQRNKTQWKEKKYYAVCMFTVLTLHVFIVTEDAQ